MHLVTLVTNQDGECSIHAGCQELAILAKCPSPSILATELDDLAEGFADTIEDAQSWTSY